MVFKLLKYCTLNLPFTHLNPKETSWLHLQKTPPSKKELGAPSFFGKPVSPPHPHAFDEYYLASVRFQFFLYEAQKYKEVHSKRIESGGYVTTSTAGNHSISLPIGEMDNVVK